MPISARKLSSSQTANPGGVPSEASLRILHLHAGNLYGGVETLLHTLARLRHLRPNIEPHFGLCFEGRLSQELQAAGVPVHKLGAVRISRPWTMWRARRRLRELLRRERYDAVVCHMSWPLAVFGREARDAGQKLIFWVHSRLNGRSWLERMAQRITPDFAISPSRFIAASLATFYPQVPAGVVYCPLELTESPEALRWRAEVRSDLKVADEEVVIVQVSRYEALKGHVLLLRALARIKSGKWICWMVGGPQNAQEESYFSEVQRVAENLGLTDRIRFLGQRSDVSHLLAGADIFCQPNQGPEGFGIVFVEALWAGRPVVTTAIGGALEIVDETCGFLTKPGDPISLAESLERLIVSPDLRSRLGAAGPTRARQLCEPLTQMQILDNLMHQAIGRGSA